MCAAGPVIVNHTQVARALPGGADGAVESFDAHGLPPGDTELIAGALAALARAEIAPDVICAPDDQAAALLQTFLAERADEHGQVAPAIGGAFEARFDRSDLLGWLPTAVPYIRARLGIARRDPRPPMPTGVDAIPDRCTIVVLGDWGTGLYGARPAAQTIARRADHDVLVHLGDVYYSGSAAEIQSRFLDLWAPMVHARPGVLSRACNSNHEMYSGGGPYFTRTLPALDQPSPVFVLENAHWVLVGLDTAYVDHDLDDEQVAVLDRVVAEAADRRLVLLSHHQPYSLLAAQGPKVVRRLRPLLDARRITAWYWGHEHRCVLYDEHPAWGVHGRCVGHGGMPYARDDLGAAPRRPLADEHAFRALRPTAASPGGRVLDGPNDYLGDQRDRYGPNGFLRLELDGPHLNESLVTPGGTVLWQADLD